MSEEAESGMSRALTVLREVMADRRHRTSPAVSFNTDGMPDETTDWSRWQALRDEQLAEQTTVADNTNDWADAPPDASEDVDSL